LKRMSKLKLPSQELAKRVLTEVEFEDRLVGFSLHQHRGPNPIAMYSFDEVFSFLKEPHPRINFTELEMWVRKTIDDQELAEQIVEAVGKGKSEQNRTERIRKLMEERFKQCKRLLPEMK
jgi:hypothetical protein